MERHCREVLVMLLLLHLLQRRMACFTIDFDTRDVANWAASFAASVVSTSTEAARASTFRRWA
jgi:hypothetical protein